MDFSAPSVDDPLSFGFAISHLHSQLCKFRFRVGFVLHVCCSILFLVFAFMGVIGDSGYSASHSVFEVLAEREAPPTPYSDTNDVSGGPQYAANFHTIRRVEDITLWFTEVVLPTFYDYLNRTEPAMRSNLQGTLAVPKGPVRVRFINMQETKRRVDSDIVRPFSFDLGGVVAQSIPPVYPPYDESQIDKEPMISASSGFSVVYVEGGPACVESSGTHEWRFACGGHVVDFLPSFSYEDALATWQSAMELGVLSGSRTRLVEVMFYTYVASSDRYVTSTFQIEITAGGSLFPRLHTIPVYCVGSRWLWAEWVAVSFVAVFIFSICFLLFLHVRSTVQCFGWLEGILDLYSFFEIAQIGMLVASLACYVSFRRDYVSLHGRLVDATGSGISSSTHGNSGLNSTHCQ